MKREHINQYFLRWLDRFAVPRHLSDKDQAQKDETRALVDTVTRYAPDRDYEGWLARLTVALERDMTHRSWPTAGEIAKLAKKMGAGARPSEIQMDEFEVTAKRMAEGAPVGDGYLWGRKAVELLRRGLVSQEQIKAYRAGFVSGLSLYTEEDRNRLLAELDHRHRRAAEDRGGEVGHYDTRLEEFA